MSHFDCQYFWCKESSEATKKEISCAFNISAPKYKSFSQISEEESKVSLVVHVDVEYIAKKKKNLSFYFKSFILLTFAETVLMSYVEKKSFLFKSVVLQAK